MMARMLALEPAAGVAPEVRGIEVWYVDLVRTGPLLDAREAALAYLSDAEIARATAMTGSARERDLWRWAHIALRLVLERWVGAEARRTPFNIGTRGKPSLAVQPASDFNLDFSLAHSADAALIGIVSKGSIGVDIEAIRDLKMSAQRVHKLEAAGAALAPGLPLPDAPGARRTLQAWVRFEAVSKARGSGIGPGLGGLRQGAGPVAEGAAAEGLLSVRDLAAPQAHAAALATLGNQQIPAFIVFPAEPALFGRTFALDAADGR